MNHTADIGATFEEDFDSFVKSRYDVQLGSIEKRFGPSGECSNSDRLLTVGSTTFIIELKCLGDEEFLTKRRRIGEDLLSRLRKLAFSYRCEIKLEESPEFVNEWQSEKYRKHLVSQIGELLEGGEKIYGIVAWICNGQVILALGDPDKHDAATIQVTLVHDPSRQTVDGRNAFNDIRMQPRRIDNAKRGREVIRKASKQLKASISALPCPVPGVVLIRPWGPYLDALDLKDICFGPSIVEFPIDDSGQLKLAEGVTTHKWIEGFLTTADRAHVSALAVISHLSNGVGTVIHNPRAIAPMSPEVFRLLFPRMQQFAFPKEKLGESDLEGMLLISDNNIDYLLPWAVQ